MTVHQNLIGGEWVGSEGIENINPFAYDVYLSGNMIKGGIVEASLLLRLPQQCYVQRSADRTMIFEIKARV